MSGRLHRTVIVAATAGCLVAVPADAQDDVAQGPDAPVGPVEQAGSLPGERIQVDAGTGDGSASVSFELPIRSYGESGTRDAGVIAYRTDTFNLIVSTPWDGENDAQPATLDGLASGTKLTFRWGRHVGFLRRERTDEMRAIEADAREACRVTARTEYARQEQAARHTPPDTADPGALERRRQVLSAQLERSLDACAYPPGGWGNLIHQHRRARSLEYIRLLRPRGSREFGLEASVGRNGFEFVDAANLARLEQTKTQWSARGYFTYFPLGSRTAFTISAAYERAYEAADEAVFCPANPNNVVVQCTTAPGGPPELNESALISAGVRHRIASGPLANFAIAPVITYDAVDDVTGIDVPVYFIPNSDNGLTGGVRFGYRSDRDNEFSVGIFIGAAFDILN